jgi:hypothetical protein
VLGNHPLKEADLDAQREGAPDAWSRANRVALACGSGAWPAEGRLFLGLCIFFSQIFLLDLCQSFFDQVVLTEAAEVHDFFSPFNSIKVR